MRTWKSTPNLYLVAAAIVANAGCSSSTEGRIVGTVTLAGASDASGVLVSVEGKAVITGSDGTFRFDRVAAGTRTVRARQEGYKLAEATVAVIADSEVQAALSLERLDSRNRAPIIAGLSAAPPQLAPKGTASLVVTANDPDGDALSYRWTAPPDWVLTPDGARAQVRAPELFEQVARISVQVEDGRGGSASGDLLLSTITRQGPVITSISALPPSVPKRGAIQLLATASDPTGLALSYKWTPPPGWVLVGAGAQAQLSAPDQAGVTGTVQLTVTSASELTATGSVFVSTLPNGPPLITSLTATPPSTGRAGTSTLEVAASDPDGDALLYRWTLPAGWTGASATSRLTLTAPDAYGVNGTVSVEVSDGADKVSAGITVSTAANRSPAIASLVGSPNPVAPAAAIQVTASASDPDGDPLAYAWSVQDPAWSVTGNKASATATSPGSYGSKTSVALAVSDGFGGTATASLSVSTYACASGLADCDGSATNGCEATLASDARNCGACGSVCPGTGACNAGVCTVVCPAGTTSCGGSCVNTATDSAHCGACGTACAAASRCCAGACVNTSGDRNNCGGCGTACGAIEFCEAGACKAVLLGSGKDGALAATATAKTDAVKSALLGNNPAGQPVLGVVSTSGFAAGDEVLVITIIDPATTGSIAGQFETLFVKSVDSAAGTLTLDRALSKSYSPPAIHQVIRVPQYTDVNVEGGGLLTCDAWNGSTGGVLFFRATGTVNVKAGGTISTTGKGFRGGPGTTVVWNCGTQGESTGGLGTQSRAANRGGGGASSPDTDCVTTASGNGSGGGAGGGYGTAGANGASNHAGFGNGGGTYGDAALLKWSPGSGGGGSGKDDNAGDPDHANGGAGGGIVVILASNIVANGAITAVGARGENGAKGGGGGSEVGGGGGGSGGTLTLGAIQLSLGAGSVSAVGGAGGNPVSFGGAGGAGGAGRIRIDYGTLNSQTYPSGSPGVTDPPAFLGNIK